MTIETDSFALRQTRRGFRLVCKVRSQFPRSRRITPADVAYLRDLDAASFDSAAVVGFGVGIARR